jgi:hypothetical protein
MNTLHELYNALNRTEVNDLIKINALDYFRFEVAQNILKTFLCYPTVESIYFDFGEIERISKVWEGSDEETILLGNRLWDTRENIENSEGFKNSHVSFDKYVDIFLKHNKDIGIPKFKDINDALACENQLIYKNNHNPQSNIEFIDASKHYSEITSLFYFLTEEPSTLTNLLKENKKIGIDWVFEFNHKFNDIASSQNLESQLLKFLGPKNHALLMSISLNLNPKKSTKLKI